MSLIPFGAMEDRQSRIKEIEEGMVTRYVTRVLENLSKSTIIYNILLKMPLNGQFAVLLVECS
jgi:hypothetical protein